MKCESMKEQLRKDIRRWVHVWSRRSTTRHPSEDGRRLGDDAESRSSPARTHNATGTGASGVEWRHEPRDGCRDFPSPHFYPHPEWREGADSARVAVPVSRDRSESRTSSASSLGTHRVVQTLTECVRRTWPRRVGRSMPTCRCHTKTYEVSVCACGLAQPAHALCLKYPCRCLMATDTQYAQQTHKVTRAKAMSALGRGSSGKVCFGFDILAPLSI